MKLLRHITTAGLHSEACEFTDGACAIADYTLQRVEAYRRLPHGYSGVGEDVDDLPWPRLFHLLREEDETGNTGTGVVAEGVVFTSGACVLRWLSDTASTIVYDFDGEAGFAAMEKVHGHNGRTKVIWRTVSEGCSPVASG